MENFYLSSDLFTKVQATISIPFIPLEAISRRNSLVSPKIKIINQTGHESHFGRTRVRKSIGWRNWCARRAEKRWTALKSVPITAPATTHFSSKTRTATNWKFAVGKARSLLNKGRQRPADWREVVNCGRIQKRQSTGRTPKRGRELDAITRFASWSAAVLRRSCFSPNCHIPGTGAKTWILSGSHFETVAE